MAATTVGFGNVPPKMPGGMGGNSNFNVAAANTSSTPAMNQAPNSNMVPTGGDVGSKMHSGTMATLQGVAPHASGNVLSSIGGGGGNDPVPEKDCVAELTKEEWCRIESLTSLELGKLDFDVDG